MRVGIESTDSVRAYLSAFESFLREPTDESESIRRDAFAELSRSYRSEAGVERLRRVIESTMRRGERPPTAAEERVLVLRLRGLSLSAIAELLGVSEGTVNKHASSICRKAGTSNPFLLAAWAREYGYW